MTFDSSGTLVFLLPLSIPKPGTARHIGHFGHVSGTFSCITQNLSITYIIISFGQISAAIANVVSNVSEVSGMKDCMLEMLSVSGSRLFVEKICGLRRVRGASRALCVVPYHSLGSTSC